MAFDGFTMAALTNEFSSVLTEGRLLKVAQPEPDELLLSIKNNRKTYRLAISASPSLPLVYFTEESRVSPLTAPNFCMLLRKHLNGAKILSIKQIGLERVIEIKMENLNELGDLVHKSLIIEIMGKHSNIIFLDENRKIIDSIKHVSSLVSSVREVLPGRDYFIPNTKEKHNPFDLTTEQWMNEVVVQPVSVAKGLCNYFTGFSFTIAHEIAYRSGIDGDAPFASLNGNQLSCLYQEVKGIITKTKENIFTPEIVFDGKEPVEFCAFQLTMYENMSHSSNDSMSHVVEQFYKEKEIIQRIRQKSTDLRKNVNTILERDRKKFQIQTKQLKDTEKRDKYKVYGELINTYGYQLTSEDKSLECVNYYDNTEVKIPIDNTLTVTENANKYFNRYNKLKRTFEAVTLQLKDTNEQIQHLETILTALDIARQEEDLVLIKQELIDSGYMKSHGGTKKKNSKAIGKSKPIHYVSSDGYDMYVGKNNYQNDELTFKFATGNDWWFHSKNVPGSHVIIKCNNEEPPISTFEEAASLAAFYSKNKNSDKVEIDYTQKKNVKKPNGSKPGFVVYYTNYSMVATPDISNISELDS